MIFKVQNALNKKEAFLFHEEIKKKLFEKAVKPNKENALCFEFENNIP